MKMRRLNRRGKITLFSLIVIIASITIGVQFHKKQLTERTAVVAAMAKENVNKTKKSHEDKNSGTSKEKGVEKHQTSEKKEKTSSKIYKKPSIPIVKPSKEKVIYLTFDDGPSNRIEDLMNTLEKYKADATFFWLEPNIKRFSKEAKDAVKRGFSIGLHGVTHDAKKIYASSNSVVNEMDTANHTLKEITGKSTRLIRTPYGSYPYMTPQYKAAVDNAGFILWDWNVDSMDWKFRNGRYINEVIQQVENLESKNITPVILLHDRAETINSLPKLLKYFKKNGYTFKKIKQNIIPIQF